MTFQMRTGIFRTDTEYGIALLDEDDGHYYTLNPSGAFVLCELLHGNAEEEIAQGLTEKYQVSRDEASRDVAGLIGHLLSAGVIEQVADQRDTGRRGRR